jgi:hypothetical protein
MRRWLLILAVSVVPACADVTIRMKLEFKAAVPLPPEVAAQMPGDIVMQVKGTRGVTNASKMVFIGDAARNQILLLDPAGKRYAATSAEAYMKALEAVMPKMPAGAAGSMTATNTARATGRTTAIQGIQAEERELVLSMDAPAGVQASGPFMKMVLQVWSAQSGEDAKVPALREIQDYSKWSMGAMNPLTSMSKSLGQLPGFAEAFGKFFEDIQKNGALVLRVHADVFMPAMAELMKNMPPGANPFGANIDPNGSLIQMNQEVIEFSTAPIPDSAFAVPAGYKTAELADIVKGMIGTAGQPGLRQ